MKKTIVLSLVAATLLFTGCGEDAKKAVTDAASGAVESAKKVASDVTDTAKVEAERLAASAAEKVGEAATALKERASSAVDSATEMASETTEKAEEVVSSVKETVSTENASGRATFAKCAGCHGANGKTKALGKSEIIAGQSAADLEAKLTEYKAGTRNVAGMGMLMKGQVASLDEASIKAIAEYISGL